MMGKVSFSLVLCCFLLASSVMLIQPGRAARQLVDVHRRKTGETPSSKVGVRRSHSSTAPSESGQDAPHQNPSSATTRRDPVSITKSGLSGDQVACGTAGAAYRSCLASRKSDTNCGTYNRSCKP